MIREYFQLRKKREKFQNLMVSIGLDSNFYLIEDKPIKNGHVLKIGIPTTSNYKKFEEKKEQLESHFKGIIEMEKIRFSSMIQMKVITKDLGKYQFEVVKTYANNLFIAREFDTTPFFIDLDKEGHVLIAGQSGTGKTFLLSSLLCNLIATNEDYIEVHLSQIMKGEVGQFANCKCVKSVNYNLSEVAALLTKLKKKVDERSKLFSSLGIKNLTHYIKKTKKYMKRIFFVIEEVSFFIPNDADPEDIKSLKAKCWDAILVIVKAGRSAGIHFLSVTQRSTVANLPSEVKAQMCCITTKQRSGLDSRNIIEVDDAKDLKDRECLVWGRDGLKLLKLPFIDEDFNDLKKFVPEIIVYDDSEEVKKEVKTKSFRVESFNSYDDIKLEDYNKITAKKENIVVNDEASQEVSTEEPPKKKRGRRKKGAIIENDTIAS